MGGILRMKRSVDKIKMVELFSNMIKARVLAQRVSQLTLEGKVPGWTHARIGQEAVGVGICAALRPSDYVFRHIGHAYIVGKGADLKRVAAELLGRETGVCKGKSGEHLADISIGLMGLSGVLGTAMSTAVGVALSCKYRVTDQVTVSCFGDGSATLGTLHESLNMASLWKLPIVFCCENNGWAQFSPQQLTTVVRDIANLGSGYGIPGQIVDGDDVLAVFQASQDAVEHARRGNGPSLLEMKTHRWHGHYIGDSQKYRSAEEIQGCTQFDPIPKLETKLIKEEIATKEEIELIKHKIQSEVEEAIAFAEASPWPQPEEAMEDIYYEGVR
jgi:TPP-dependent pyruvate/acetoin dehydrogenase alpha subunit